MAKKTRVQNKSKSEWERDVENPDDARQTTYSSKYRGSWANLPDLVLEQIFQYLPYKVSTF